MARKPTAKPAKTGQQQDSGRFKKGQSGNPKGRPEGSRSKATLAAEVLLDGEVENLTRKAIDLAKGGDIAALRLCMDRIVPPRKDRPIRLDLPEMETAEDLSKALGTLVKAMAEGELTPVEAEKTAAVLEIRRRAIETLDHETRLEELERRANGEN